MKGSIFPNSVRVDQSALRYSETSKSEEILRNRVDWTSRGVLSGFEVSVNAVDDTLIDLTQGSGFTPDGAYIETTSDYYSISLDDYTLGAINYVCAIYTEASTYRQPHESDGSSYPTRSEMSWRIRVYEESAYNAISVTDANFANDARDRMIVMAKVSANGAAVSLTSNNITSPVDYNAILYSTPSELATITGVTILSVSHDTGPGTGTLSYTYAVGPVYTFTWTSAVGGAGVAVPVTADGYWDFQDGLGEYIRCYIVLSQLPVTGVFPMTEDAVITNLYYQAMPRLTAEDTYHRNLLGTGVLSPTNPHRTSISDLAGDALPQIEEHQDVMHSNGIWRDSTANILVTSVVTTPPVADTLNIQIPGAADLFYINGNKLSLVNNSSIPFATWIWGVGMDSRTNFFEVYVNDTGDILANRKATYPALRGLTGTWIVDMSDNYPAGNYNLKYEVVGLSTHISWDGGRTIYLGNANWGIVGNDRVVRLFDEEGVYWIDLWINMDDAKIGGNDGRFNIALGPITDVITVEASPDWDANMQIASISYWWDTTAMPPKGKLGYAPNKAIRRVIDKRPFGTLGSDEFADEALQDLIYHQQDEMHFSGVLLNRRNPAVEFVVESTSALDMVITGGDYYCRGRRLQASGDTVSLVDNVTNLVWLDMEGSYNVIDVTTDYAGDLQEAMRYVIGDTSYVPGIDSETHRNDALDPPERGVLLYMAVTAAGAITYYEDMTRNINGPVDPWSVGGRYYDFSAGRLAAFNSLGTAFEYAEVTNKAKGIVITVVGATEINNKRITQPVGTVVTGGKESLYGGIITINHAPGLGIDGVWVLSEGCTVSNISIESGVSKGCPFILGTASVSNCDNVTIEGCVFDCGVYTTTSYFIVLREAAGDVNNLVVKDNVVTAGSSFMLNAGLAGNYYNFKVYGNTVDIIGGSASYAITLNSSSTGKDIFLSNNSFSGNYGVRLIDFDSCNISNNSFYIGDAGASTVVGMYLTTVSESIVSNNTFKELTGNTSLDMTAIQTASLDGVGINNNSIADVHYGIVDTASGASDNLIVEGNIVYASDNGAGAGGIGIFTYSDHAIIANNIVYAEAEGIACGPNGGADKIKIRGNLVEVTTVNGGTLNAYNIGTAGCCGITSTSTTRDIDIEDNRIKMIGPGNVLLDASAGIFIGSNWSNFTVKGNITSAACTSLSGGATGAWHIYASGIAGVGSYLISDNKIDNRKDLAVPSVMYGLRFSDTTGAGAVGVISNNLIDGLNITTDPLAEFTANSTASLLVVSKNTVTNMKGVATNSRYLLPAPAQTRSTLDNILMNDGAGILVLF